MKPLDIMNPSKLKKTDEQELEDFEQADEYFGYFGDDEFIF